MSPLRLLLEGPDLETLLEQIRTEYGTEARIVQAEKVRRGGVGGFFARERFTIQVEVPHARATPKRPPARSGSPVQSVMDLVDQLNREDESLHRGMIDAPLTTSSSRAKAAQSFPPVAPSPAPASSSTAPHVTVIQSLAVPAATMSTQSATFAEVMSRLAQGIDSPALTPTSASDGPDLACGTGPGQPTSLPSSVPIRHAALVPQPAARTALAPGRLSTGAQMVARATRMGVPWYVLADIEEPTDVYRRLLAWVESRPASPMVASSPGQVIVVVGEVTAATRVAAALARELGVDEADIHVAVPASSSAVNVNAARLMSDVSEIALCRVQWRQSAGSTVVVLEAALPPADQRWLAAVVSALSPTFTWAVAQASTKVDDVVAWASGIGDVDALALVNVSVTGDPAAALAGPLPVGLIDGHRATVTRWMAMLTSEGDLR